MATITFSVSRKIDPVGLSELLIRFRHGKICQRGKTKIFVPAQYWDEANQRMKKPKVRLLTEEQIKELKQLDDFNSQIEALAAYISQSFNEAITISNDINTEWLKNIIANYHSQSVQDKKQYKPSPIGQSEKKEQLSEIFQRAINARDICTRRKDHYYSVIRSFDRFLIYNNIQPSLDSIDDSIINEYANFLKIEHTFIEVTEDEKKEKSITFIEPKYKVAFESVEDSMIPQERGSNTISGYLKKIKTLFKWANQNGLTNKNPFDEFRIKSEMYGTPIFITKEERNKLYEHDFSANPTLDAQRDIFIFQCYTACRVSDLLKLKKSSVINGILEYIPSKTKKTKVETVRVPLNSIPLQIIKKYSNLPDQQLLPFISSYRYNQAIKNCFLLAGLNRMVTILNPKTLEEEQKPLYAVASSHMGRRTFIGNIYKDVKDPNIIGKMTGHTEGSRAFARYRNIDEDILKDVITYLD